MKPFTYRQKERIKKAFKGVDRPVLVKRLDSSIGTIKLIATGLERVSGLRALSIERLTDGKVGAHILRPDLFKKPKEEK